MFKRNTLVPELMVTDLPDSLNFWVSCLGFTIAYQRPEHGFAYLDLNGAADVEVGQREFIVQDPDGYLVRLVQRLGERAV